MNEREFEGQIKVASRIVDTLSSGLYESPAACLKELINNSFDADATRVEVFVKPDADRIIIEDDGLGMSPDEFVEHFSLISESHKRDTHALTPSGRKVIGKIGIGFIAANEICDEMVFESTKLGSPELMTVTINFAEMRKTQKQRSQGDTTVAKADFKGTVSEVDPSAHFTRVLLQKVRGRAQAILASARAAGREDALTLYGLTLPKVRDLLAGGIRSWTDFDFYSQTLMGVALNVPIRYHANWLPRGVPPSLTREQKVIEDLGFTLMYDGAEVRKPIVLNPGTQRFLLRRFSHKGKHVSAHGYFFAQHGTMRPKELMGLLLRVRQAAVGGYDASFMGFPASHGPLLQRWISAEIWADDRLEDAMNIDRKTLRITHPAYSELQEAVHRQLEGVIKDVRSEIYSSGASERRQQNAITQVERLIDLSEHSAALPARRAIVGVASAWLRPDDKDLERQLNRRFTIAELYEVVLEVAGEFLPPEDFARFVAALTRRLQGAQGDPRPTSSSSDSSGRG